MSLHFIVIVFFLLLFTFSYAYKRQFTLPLSLQNVNATSRTSLVAIVFWCVLVYGQEESLISQNWCWSIFIVLKMKISVHFFLILAYFGMTVFSCSSLFNCKLIKTAGRVRMWFYNWYIAQWNTDICVIFYVQVFFSWRVQANFDFALDIWANNLGTLFFHLCPLWIHKCNPFISIGKRSTSISTVAAYVLVIIIIIINIQFHVIWFIVLMTCNCFNYISFYDQLLAEFSCFGYVVRLSSWLAKIRCTLYFFATFVRILRRNFI